MSQVLSFTLNVGVERPFGLGEGRFLQQLLRKNIAKNAVGSDSECKNCRLRSSID